jgi:hypothetical protein
MRRKSLILAILIALVLVCGVGASLALLVRHMPAWYRDAELSAGSERRKKSSECVSEFSHLLNVIQYQDDPDRSALQDNSGWMAEFTDEGINSFLVEDFLRTGWDQKLLPEGISEPRVVFQGSRGRLGFRYGTGRWSTIISLDFSLWVARAEPNVVCVEFHGLHAGALPINAQSLLEHVSEAARRYEKAKIEVSWYRHNGHRVAMLRFESSQPHPTVQLKHVVMEDGKLIIQGSYTDPTPREKPVNVNMTPAGN